VKHLKKGISLTKIIQVTAAIIEQNGKILIARRKEGHPLAYHWEFPGGKIECHETPEQCLQRELFEEFGITCRIKEFLINSPYTYPHITINLMAYKTELISGDFKLTDHDKIAWVKIEEFPQYDFAPADIPIVNTLLQMTNIKG
jgi:8-oxo-dGTP diphosphatase